MQCNAAAVQSRFLLCAVRWERPDLWHMPAKPPRQTDDLWHMPAKSSRQTDDFWHMPAKPSRQTDNLWHMPAKHVLECAQLYLGRRHGCSTAATSSAMAAAPSAASASSSARSPETDRQTCDCFCLAAAPSDPTAAGANGRGTAEAAKDDSASRVTHPSTAPVTRRERAIGRGATMNIHYTINIVHVLYHKHVLGDGRRAASWTSGCQERQWCLPFRGDGVE
jgi:hypothetical protein